MRQRRTGLEVNWRRPSLLRAGPPLLAASLLLSSAPTVWHAAASPPLLRTEAEVAPVVDQDDTRVADQPAERRPDGASSVRPRGREAPVSLRQVPAAEPTPAAVGADPDPGDGPPPERSTRAGASERQAARQSAKSANLRVWPMPADSYTFTQAFGCVPQIAHFYQPGAGCPADRPVVHTGLDLAAPEGTPFYAAASGWVTEAGYDREVGVANTRIIIQHEGRNDGFATEYLHWIATFVEVGDHVDAGQL
ncbi:MAG: M23 family metallopeptidase, partial [Thermomicrobiales bacterium]|nr:M23 family metallopeptidase [Thermomicrobiales bacterium]